MYPGCMGTRWVFLCSDSMTDGRHRVEMYMASRGPPEGSVLQDELHFLVRSAVRPSLVAQQGGTNIKDGSQTYFMAHIAWGGLRLVADRRTPENIAALRWPTSLRCRGSLSWAVRCPIRPEGSGGVYRRKSPGRFAAIPGPRSPKQTAAGTAMQSTFQIRWIALHANQARRRCKPHLTAQACRPPQFSVDPRELLH